jgi:probable rRNA maturation factor
MLRALGAAEAELSVLLTGDHFIHALNRTYRGKDRPTDVLAFAAREAAAARSGPAAVPVGADVLGDVVISLDTAARQAVTLGRPLDDEVLHLLAHGLLHLLGDDHRTVAEERRMNARADLLRAAALGARVTVPAPTAARPAVPSRTAARAVDTSVAGNSRRQAPRRGASRGPSKK